MESSLPVEVEGLTPCAVQEKTLAEIERFEIFHGNQKLPLAELFSVSGDPSDARLELTGNLAGVHWIGAHTRHGEIHVQGNAGRHVGSQMHGGKLFVHGNTGDYTGGELHGGLIHVYGNSGNLVGSAYRGSSRGMTGGTLLVDGDVGDEVGHTMRRGLLAVGGNCGDFVGINMLAGTILIFGECGLRAAAGMRRGTIGLLGPAAPTILCTFRKSCLYHPPILPLLFRHLRSAAFTVPASCWNASYRLYHGDHVTGGRGELLVREAAAS